MDARLPAWRHLRHWLIHVPLSASASFVFAYHTEWHNAQGVAGMIAGVAAFVALYTAVWSSRWFGRRVPPGSEGRRALLYGTYARSTLGLLGCASFAFANNGGALTLLFAPDFWAGTLAYSLVARVGRSSVVRALRIAVAGDDPHVRAHHPLVGDVNSLLPTFLITVVDGLLLTVLLLAFAWFCRLLIALHGPPGPGDPEF